MGTRRGVALGVVVLVVAISAILYVSASAAPDGKRIGLSILYVGHPGSEREKDFTTFLGQEFARVGTADLKGFNGTGEGYDVLMIDYDGDRLKSPRPNLPAGYCRATITVGVVGALIGNPRGLKTAYL